MHTMGKSDLTPEEHDTTRKSKESCTIITASGSITTTEEATICVRDVVMCINVHILERLTCPALARKIFENKIGVPMIGMKENRPP